MHIERPGCGEKDARAGEKKRPRQRLKEPTLGQIFRAVSLLFDIPERHLLSPRRCMVFVRPRFIFYAVARDMTSKSIPTIGAFCKRDHTTVMHGCKKVTENLEAYAADIDRVKELVGLIDQDTPE